VVPKINQGGYFHKKNIFFDFLVPHKFISVGNLMNGISFKMASCQVFGKNYAYFRKTFTISSHSHRFHCHFTHKRNIIFSKLPGSFIRICHYVREIWFWKVVACIERGCRIVQCCIILRFSELNLWRHEATLPWNVNRSLFMHRYIRKLSINQNLFVTSKPEDHRSAPLFFGPDPWATPDSTTVLHHCVIHDAMSSAGCLTTVTPARAIDHVIYNEIYPFPFRCASTSFVVFVHMSYLWTLGLILETATSYTMKPWGKRKSSRISFPCTKNMLAVN
jgi:hypothetical protein